MRPLVGERTLNQPSQPPISVWLRQQQRARRNKQANAVLYRVHVIYQALRLDKLENVYVVLDSGPRGERNERRPHSYARTAQYPKRSAGVDRKSTRLNSSHT